MNFKKYVIEDHSDGKKYEVITDELGYIHKNSKPIEPEAKPVSFKEIERLYKKEFPESQSQPKSVNEIKKLKQLIER